MTRYRLNADGTYDVADGAHRVLRGARAHCTYRDGGGNARSVSTTERRGDDLLAGSVDGVELLVLERGESLFATISNRGMEAVLLDACAVMDCGGAAGGVVGLVPANELLYLQHGWQSWSQTAVRRLAQPESTYGDEFFVKMHLPDGHAAADERTSDSFMLLQTGAGEAAMLIGMEGAAGHFSRIRLTVHDNTVARVQAVALLDGIWLEQGASISLEPLWVGFGTAGQLYDAYVTRVAARMGRRGKHTTLQGWCSWYYYYGENTASDVSANLRAIRDNNLPLDLILVDDGYETAIGDWTSIAHDKFPHGMRAVADEIHAADKLAGIWLAPFGAARDSQLAQEHPEFLLHGENGVPVTAWNHSGAEIVALDLTRADVAEWLQDLFETVCQKWGFDAVKLDFVFAGALAGRHADRTMTRAQAFRRGLEIVGKQVGNKLIMGCGAPQLASAGLVDSMRVSQDVHFTWEPMDALNTGAVSTRHAVQNTLLRAPFNQRWWLNDPDCVIVRKSGDLNAMTRNESRSLSSIAALTGSVLLDSDNVPNLPPSSLEELRSILPALKGTARVRRWFGATDEQPAELELQLADGRVVLAVVNWARRTRATAVELPGQGAWHVYDFWRRQYLGVFRHRVPVSRHMPHQTVVLQCAPAGDEPGLVGSSRNIATADVLEVTRAEGELRLMLAERSEPQGEIVVGLPPGWRVRRATLDGVAARVRHSQASAARVRTAGGKPALLSLEFNH